MGRIGLRRSYDIRITAQSCCLLQNTGADCAFCRGKREVREVFTVYSENDRGSTLISNLFIDQYMKDANDAQLKVYLYLLRMMNAGRPTSISD